MQTQFIVAAVMSTFALSASAAPFETPYTLSAPHADFLMQLESAATAPGETGAAARTAADVLGPHMAAQERIVLPFLGLGAAATGAATADDPQIPSRMESLKAELPALVDDQADVIGALVELFAAADAEGQPEVARLAERMIWHQTSDAEVLYPAAVLIGTSVQSRITAGPTD